MQEKKYDLEDRFINFAANTILFIQTLPKDKAGDYYGSQVLRSTGSVALNFGEAQGTSTIRDYISKATISRRETRESKNNFKILDKVKYGDPDQRAWLIDESIQLTKILSKIISNKQAEQK